MMNQKVSLQQMIPLLFVLLLLGGVSLLARSLNNLPAIRMGLESSSDQAAVEAFDYERAADISAMRWQAMAAAYERAGLLNDRMDAGDVSAARWQAMGEAYEKAGLLNDRLDPGDVAAYRWEAMARAYERAGLLNDK